MSDEKAGFKIGGVFYPAPERFRVGDAVLIAEITGMPFPEFAQALDDDERRGDLVILAGLIGAAIWQSKSTLKRAQVVKIVEQIDFESLDFEGGDDTGEAKPPAEEAGDAT